MHLSRSGIDPVWWTPCVSRQRCCRCQEHVHRIRRSFADRWSTSSVLDVILTILPASLSQAATPFARGSPRLTETRAAGRRRLLVLTAFERDELTRLRRENKQLRLERDILSKAAAWFARETGALPSGSSGS